MLVENILVRPLGNNLVTLSWSDATENVWSWIFRGNIDYGTQMTILEAREIILPNN